MSYTFVPVVPVVGVVNASALNEIIYDDIDYRGIDPDWLNLTPAERRNNDMWEQQTSLIGFKDRRVKGQHVVDEKTPFSAIVSMNDGIVIQVIRSMYVINAAWCSPCYPNQGDIDTPDNDNGVLCWCLPPNYFRDEEIIKHIREWNPCKKCNTCEAKENGLCELCNN